MLGGFVKNNTFFYRVGLWGLLFSFLLLSVVCGHFQTAIHFPGVSTSANCSGSAFLTSYMMPNKDNIFSYGLFLLALIILIAFALSRKKYSNIFAHQIYIFPKPVDYIATLYNQLLEAFRRGILHSQIYNFSFIFD